MSACAFIKLRRNSLTFVFVPEQSLSLLNGDDDHGVRQRDLSWLTTAVRQNRRLYATKYE